jgi:hypothetical protein
MDTMASVRPEVLVKAVQQARARGVILPTIAQQMNPALIPPAVVARLRGLGLWDIDPSPTTSCSRRRSRACARRSSSPSAIASR